MIDEQCSRDAGDGHKCSREAHHGGVCVPWSEAIREAHARGVAEERSRCLAVLLEMRKKFPEGAENEMDYGSVLSIERAVSYISRP